MSGLKESSKKTFLISPRTIAPKKYEKIDFSFKELDKEKEM